MGRARGSGAADGHGDGHSEYVSAICSPVP
jgi:hypothetical protein